MDTKLHPIIIRVHDVIGMLHTISAGCSNQFAPAQTSTLSTPASRGQLLLLQVPRPWPAAPNHEVSSLTTSWWPFSCHLPLSRGGHSATSPSHVVAILLPPPPLTWWPFSCHLLSGTLRARWQRECQENCDNMIMTLSRVGENSIRRAEGVSGELR